MIELKVTRERSEAFWSRVLDSRADLVASELTFEGDAWRLRSFSL
jgi:hypothetical protein